MSTVVHWNGNQWNLVGAAGGNYVQVWGITANDIWAASSTAQWRTGTAANGYPFNPIRQHNPGHLGSASNDVWAVADGGVILHWNGTRWSSVIPGTTTTLVGVWGSARRISGSQVTDGTLLHGPGGGWTVVPSGSSHRLARFGSGPATCGSLDMKEPSCTGTGKSWTRTYPALEGDFRGVWGTSPKQHVGSERRRQGWALGWATWTSVSTPTTNNLDDAWGYNANDVWAVGWRWFHRALEWLTWTSSSIGNNESPVRSLGAGPADQ